MSLKKFLLSIFIIIIINIISSISCDRSTNLQENTLEDFVDEASGTGYDSQAYPSYWSMIDDSKDLIEQSTDDVLTLKSSDQVAVTTVSVHDFGAKGDGETDDTEAFVKAWKVACSSKNAAVLVVPQKIYWLKPIRFSGPCLSQLMVQIVGTLEASDDRSDFRQDGKHWLIFDSVRKLLLDGGGTINGNGKEWWQNSCKINKSKALAFYKCKDLIVKNLKIQDAQQIHLSFQKCMNVLASNLSITAPEKSPNTDGIHVTNTQDILITTSIISTGDDCISIVSGSEKVQAMNITCGPGHGISIGSLGSGKSEAYVSEVALYGAKLIGTTNGVRIKTWQGGSGSANNITFENIEMLDVTNPILIDQYYCDSKKPCKEQKSAVQVQNVLYKNIKGTSASDVAIKFDCSKNFPCQGIVLQDIKLEHGGGKTAKALCNNINFTSIGVVSPLCYQAKL
ncbi:putative polygalacturonase [Rosa chinensis]|uniref:endo-polygalacturonase n=2 Tax=Rosa chinensis TaxID=74649 RepID=A0A2P6RDZ8_ROSCH|nr:putative polygalacturonase [Rosa chinensis]